MMIKQKKSYQLIKNTKEQIGTTTNKIQFSSHKENH